MQFDQHGKARHPRPMQRHAAGRTIRNRVRTTQESRASADLMVCARSEIVPHGRRQAVRTTPVICLPHRLDLTSTKKSYKNDREQLAEYYQAFAQLIRELAAAGPGTPHKTNGYVILRSFSPLRVRMRSGGIRRRRYGVYGAGTLNQPFWEHTSSHGAAPHSEQCEEVTTSPAGQ